MNTRYDPSTDSLYVEVRPLPAHRTVEIEEDVMLDLGEDGRPVGYDIQHASTKMQVIGRLVLEQAQAAE
jgi:uncharacterized protein YuzE